MALAYTDTSHGSVVYMFCRVIMKIVLNMGIVLKLCLHTLHKGPKVFVTAMGQSNRKRRSWKAPNKQVRSKNNNHLHAMEY